MVIFGGDKMLTEISALLFAVFKDKSLRALNCMGGYR